MERLTKDEAGEGEVDWIVDWIGLVDRVMVRLDGIEIGWMERLLV